MSSASAETSTDSFYRTDWIHFFSPNEPWRSCECRGTWACVSCSVQGWAQAAGWARHEPHGFGGCSLVYLTAHWALLRRIFSPKTFVSCPSSTFSLQTISLTHTFYVPQAVQRVSDFLSCKYTKTWNAQGKRRLTKGRKCDWTWAKVRMAVVWLEEVADIMSVIWGGTGHFHPHDDFYRSRFYSLSGPFSYSCYLRGSRVNGMEISLEIYRVFHPVFSALFHSTGLNRHRVVASCPC